MAQISFAARAQTDAFALDSVALARPGHCQVGEWPIVTLGLTRGRCHFLQCTYSDCIYN